MATGITRSFPSEENNHQVIFTRFLIVQTVVTLATEDDNYFETPAPGWTWGSRFSYGFLRREITKRGYRIVDTDRNVLTGNDRPEDRGSAYFLIARDDR
jgi:hypothetical protein